MTLWTSRPGEEWTRTAWNQPDRARLVNHARLWIEAGFRVMVTTNKGRAVFMGGSMGEVVPLDTPPDRG